MIIIIFIFGLSVVSNASSRNDVRILLLFGHMHAQL